MLHRYFRSLAPMAGALFLALLPATEALAQYCVPPCATSCTVGGGDYIQSFSTTGGATNISNLNSGCNGNTNNYIYYQAMTLTAAQGGTVAWSLTNCPGNPELYGIWADWNGNGTFDPGESVYNSTTTVAPGATVSGTFTVPATAVVGSTRLRVRASFYSGTQPGPCGSMFYGETEDYNLVITSGTSTGCTAAPVAGTVNVNPTTICPSTPTTLYLTGNTTGTLLQWQYALGGTAPWVNVAGATASALTLPNPITAGWYRVQVTCPGTTFTSYTAPFQISFNNIPCQDSVWPGDANYDYIVNNMDALAVGVAYNHVGPARPNASANYVAQYATNWAGSFFNGVNYKNADCNGDSLVTNADLAAITANYGLSHPKGPGTNGARITGLPDLTMDLTGINLIPGSTVTIPLRFGDAASPVTKIYGIAGTLQLQGFSQGTAPVLSFSNTWIGSAGNTLSLVKSTNTNAVDWAVSRTNHTNTSGHGVLGSVTFTVPANAGGNVTFHLQDVTLIDSTGAAVTGYNVVDQTATIVPTGIAGILGTGNTAAIVPNPSGDAAVLQLQLDEAADLEVTVTDITGRNVWKQMTHTISGASALQLPGAVLAPGVYVVVVRIPATGALQTMQWIRR